MAVVDRDLRDAKVAAVSSDWRLAMAYNAGPQLATLALAAEGFRPERLQAHERAIQSLRYTVKADGPVIDLLDAIRRKRNLSNYERAGAVSESEVDEVHKTVVTLRKTVLAWLAVHHASLLE
ncbi:MAG: DNA-binding protein [Gemmatimonadales bacterium]